MKARVDFATRIIVHVEGREIDVSGSSKDISLTGVFVHTKEVLAVDTPCSVEIILSGTIEPLHLKMNGRTVRKTDQGVAVTFEAMDIDSYTHLKNIVRYNAPDPDAVR